MEVSILINAFLLSETFVCLYIQGNFSGNLFSTTIQEQSERKKNYLKQSKCDSNIQAYSVPCIARGMNFIFA